MITLPFIVPAFNNHVLYFNTFPDNVKKCIKDIIEDTNKKIYESKCGNIYFNNYIITKIAKTYIIDRTTCFMIEHFIINTYRLNGYIVEDHHIYW